MREKTGVEQFLLFRPRGIPDSRWRRPDGMVDSNGSGEIFGFPLAGLAGIP
ncbi:MAG TPA: hypothetical protein PLS03_05280 [Terrimicrobiaceae bacterium]|nr:hypothetical protein [Terrimicrobiaceae bacterium]